MKFIKGKNRTQTEYFCLELAIDQDNEVRLIELFVSSLKLSDFGFKMDFTAYNLRRIFNILNPNEIKAYLKPFALYFWHRREYFKPYSANLYCNLSVVD